MAGVVGLVRCGGAGEVWWGWCGVWRKCSGAGVVWRGWCVVLAQVWCGRCGVVGMVR